MNKKSISFIFIFFTLIVSTLTLASFYFGMIFYIRSESELAINEAISFYQDDNYNYGEEAERLYGLGIDLDQDYQVQFNYGEETFGFPQKRLQELADLAKEHDSLNKLHHISLEHSDYYITVIANGDALILIIVDVTPEMNLTYFISIILGLVLTLGMIGASISGLYLGKRIERDRKQQKEFFENASHELKTPLMVIEGYADGLKQELISHKEASQNILNESDKMKKLVEEIMNLSKLESGATELNRMEISLDELIDNVIYPIAFQARQKQININQDIKDDLISVDPQQFDHVLNNILSNALRYAETTVKVTANKSRISIFNDGQPLDEAAIEHIFDRFYTGKNGNTGIGMALTKEIVRKHGWKIKVENRINGVEFIIDIKS